MDIHTEVPGRKVATANVSKDSVALGTKTLKVSKLKEWTKKEQYYYGANSDETMYEDQDITPPDSQSQTPTGSPGRPSNNPATPGGLDQAETMIHPDTSSFELEQFDVDWNEWEWDWTEAETGDYGVWLAPAHAPEAEMEKGLFEGEEMESIG